MPRDGSDSPATGDADARASWHPDPFRRHDERWWDGRSWTDKVRSGGAAGIDPPGIVPAPERHGVAATPAPPITDAAEPVRYAPMNLPRVLLLGVVLLLAIVALMLVALAA